MPVVVPVLVAVLAETDPDVGFTTVLSRVDLSRETLGLMWQVEGAVLALVTAGALFSFESLVRSRPGVPLSEYAARSGLLQFLMLGAAGLLATGVALLFSSGEPAVLATGVALVTSFLGLAALPLLLHQAMRVIHPEWLRSQRLDDVRLSVEAAVRNEALERAALLQLHQWVENRPVEVLQPLRLDQGGVVELAKAAGVVYDIHLGRLDQQVGKGRPHMLLTARLGETVAAATPLVGVARPPTPSWRPVYCLARGPDTAPLHNVLSQLHEEGAQAIRSESVAAIRDVAQGYVAVWLAWPEAWERYGQRVAGGLLSGLKPWGIGPVHDLQRQISFLTESALIRGLREHILELSSVTYRVGRRAIELQATDVLRSTLEAARYTLTAVLDGDRGLSHLVNTQVVFAHAELCDFIAEPLLHRTDLVIERRLDATQAIEIIFHSMTEAIKTLAQLGDYGSAMTLDERFRRALQHWDPQPYEDAAQRMVKDPAGWGAGPTDVDLARGSLSLHDRRRDLDELRRAHRMTLLAWLLRDESPIPRSQQWRELIASMLSTLGPIEDVSEALGTALESDAQFLSRWLIVEKSFGEAHFLDTEGPLLRTFAVLLLSSSTGFDRLEPRDWMTDGRVRALLDALKEIARDPYLAEVVGLREEELGRRGSELAEVLASAQQHQRDLEQEQLSQQPLDKGKIEAFIAAVERGWQDNRVIPGLLKMCGLAAVEVPLEDWGDERYGFKPRLEPKGLFVTPTSWGGLDNYGADLGRTLARSEASELVQQIFAQGRKCRGRGDARARLRQLIDALRSDTYSPSLIILPINWRLTTSLDLLNTMDVTDNLGSVRHHVKGYFDHIPVIDWWQIPEDRLAVVDLAAFATIEEGTNESGAVLGPITSIEEIDEERAREILRNADDSGHQAERDRLLRLRTHVSARIHRPFRFRVTDPGAARTIWLPTSARD